MLPSGKHAAQLFRLALCAQRHQWSNGTAFRAGARQKFKIPIFEQVSRRDKRSTTPLTESRAIQIFNATIFTDYHNALSAYGHTSSQATASFYIHSKRIQRRKWEYFYYFVFTNSFKTYSFLFYLY